LYKNKENLYALNKTGRISSILGAIKGKILEMAPTGLAKRTSALSY